MNEIAAQLGEVGLPAPLSELAAREWDAVVVGGGHNGLTAAAYLARAGQPCSCSSAASASAAPARSSARSPTSASSISPCAYVVGLLDEVVIRELDLRRRGFECYVADPNLWVPFEDGTSFGQWLDDDRTAGATSTRPRRVSQGTSTATGPTRSSSTRSAASCARARATRGSATPRRAPRSRSSSTASRRCSTSSSSASIAEVLDDYMDDQRLKDALFGQGVIAAYGGPKDTGTASIKLMHYQGDLEGQGPVWGYVKGGMGMISFAIADAAQEAGAVLACGVPVAEIVPEEGVVLEDGTRIRARTVLCNADPKVALRLLEGQDVPADYRERLEAWKVRSPVVKFNAALNATARLDGGARRELAGARDDRRHRRPRGRPARLRGVRARRAGRRASARSTSRRATTPRPRRPGHHLLSVFGQYAPYELAEGTGTRAARRSRASSSTSSTASRPASRTASRPTRCSARPTSRSASA